MEEISKFIIYISVLNTVFIIISLKLSINALIELKALQNSTHNVTWMPWSEEDDTKLKSQFEDAEKLPPVIGSEDRVNSIMENF